MGLTIRIHDTSKPEVKEFLNYVRSLTFVEIEEDEIVLNELQVNAIEEARSLYEKNGGKTHEEVINILKSKHPKAFKS
jgi:electron transfer flavoprotein alpha/beta subunit